MDDESPALLHCGVVNHMFMGGAARRHVTSAKKTATKPSFKRAGRVEVSICQGAEGGRSGGICYVGKQ